VSSSRIDCSRPAIHLDSDLDTLIQHADDTADPKVFDEMSPCGDGVLPLSDASLVQQVCDYNLKAVSNMQIDPPKFESFSFGTDDNQVFDESQR